MTHPPSDPLARCYARLFSSSEGQKVINDLKDRTINTVCGAQTPAETLRYLEGQRALVRTIIRQIETGRAQS